MNKIYDNQIPNQIDHSICRLLSNNNISYYGKETGIYLSEKMINKVDESIRLLLLFLIKMGCKINSFFCNKITEKEELKTLWNNIKKEEKIIKTEGLNLTRIDGSSVLFKDSSFRVYWPSFEAFMIEYPKSCSKSWISIDIPNNLEDVINFMKNNQEFYPLKLIYNTKNDEYANFIVINEQSLEQKEEWRIITENIVNIFKINDKATI